jgi:hypothetical protein
MKFSCRIAIVILLCWCRLWQSYSSPTNDSSDNIVILNFDLIDALNTHHISFSLTYTDKNISLTVMNECLSYQLYPSTCVQLFKFIIQTQLGGNHLLTSKEISHQHQYFTRLVLVQELLHSSYNFYNRRDELSKEKLGR